MRPQFLVAALAGLAVAAPTASPNFEAEVHQLIARQAADVTAAADPTAGGVGAAGTLDSIIERLQSLTSTLQKVRSVVNGDFSSITSLLPSLPSLSSLLPGADASAAAPAAAAAAPAAAAAAPAA